MSASIFFRVVNRLLAEELEDKIVGLEVFLEMMGYRIKYTSFAYDSFSIYRENELMIIVYVYNYSISILEFKHSYDWDATDHFDWEYGIDMIMKIL